MFTVQIEAVFADEHGTYPDTVNFDMTDDQKDVAVTLDRIIREARSRANRELPLSLELKSVTIEIEKVHTS